MPLARLIAGDELLNTGTLSADSKAANARESYPFDITRGLSIDNFTNHEIAVREHLYKQMMVVEAV